MSNRWDVLSPRAGKEGKTFWHRVGTAWQGDKGISITFDSLPLPDAEGKVRVSLFEPRVKDGAKGGGAKTNEMNDDIPFGPEMR